MGTPLVGDTWYGPRGQSGEKKISQAGSQLHPAAKIIGFPCLNKHLWGSKRANRFARDVCHCAAGKQKAWPSLPPVRWQRSRYRAAVHANRKDNGSQRLPIVFSCNDARRVSCEASLDTRVSPVRPGASPAASLSQTPCFSPQPPSPASGVASPPPEAASPLLAISSPSLLAQSPFLISIPSEAAISPLDIAAPSSFVDPSSGSITQSQSP